MSSEPRGGRTSSHAHGTPPPPLVAEEEDAPIDAGWGVDELFVPRGAPVGCVRRGERAVARVIPPLAQVAVLLVQQPRVLVQHHRREHMTEPGWQDACHEDAERSLGEGAAELVLAIVQDCREGAHPTGARRHAIRREDEATSKRHPGVVGDILDEARRLELERPKVSRHGEARIPVDLARDLKSIGLRIGVAVSQSAVVGCAKVGGVESVLEHGVPSAWEVAHPRRHLPLPPIAQLGPVQLLDERHHHPLRLCVRCRAAAREDPQEPVHHPSRVGAALRAAAAPLTRSGLRRRVREVRAAAITVEPPAVVRAEQVAVCLDSTLGERAEPMRARIFEDVPRARLLLPTNGRAVIPDH